MFLYKFKSRYVPTGRMRTVEIEAPNKDEAIRHFKTDANFLDAFEVEEVFISPTDRQLEWAKEVGLKIPGNASIRDASAIIDRKIHHDSDPNPGLVEFAKGRGMLFSDYTGKKYLYGLVFYELPQLDKIAFFVFSVYRWLSDDRHANLDTHPQRQLFYDYAQTKIDDVKFVKSLLDNYGGSDLRFFGTLKFADGDETNGGSTSTIAYKDATNYLHEKLGLQKTRIRTIGNNIDVQKKSSLGKTRKMDRPHEKTTIKPMPIPKPMKWLLIATVSILLLVLLILTKWVWSILVAGLLFLVIKAPTKKK